MRKVQVLLSKLKVYFRRRGGGGKGDAKTAKKGHLAISVIHPY